MIKKIKTMLIALLAPFFFIQAAYCVPALHSVQQLKQPDGTTFTAKLWGDEKNHGWETLEG